VYLKSSVAYAAQTPWIQNATLRDNVLFGSAFDAEKYSTVIRACALEPDIHNLPGGDQVEIGENVRFPLLCSRSLGLGSKYYLLFLPISFPQGTNLSGGQKQRVALARAAYKEASLYLLDDPLAAVDAGVGRHIFESLIGPEGILKGKTRILVTHNTRLLPYVDRILVIKEGRLTGSGTYEQLIRTPVAILTQTFSLGSVDWDRFPKL